MPSAPVYPPSAAFDVWGPGGREREPWRLALCAASLEHEGPWLSSRSRGRIGRPSPSTSSTRVRGRRLPGRPGADGRRQRRRGGDRSARGGAGRTQGEVALRVPTVGMTPPPSTLLPPAPAGTHPGAVRALPHRGHAPVQGADAGQRSPTRPRALARRSERPAVLRGHGARVGVRPDRRGRLRACAAGADLTGAASCEAGRRLPDRYDAARRVPPRRERPHGGAALRAAVKAGQLPVVCYGWGGARAGGADYSGPAWCFGLDRPAP